MSRVLSALFALILTSAPALSQPSSIDSIRAAWVAERLVLLGDTTDQMGAFVRAVGDARVVAFGEPTHGDGAAFVVRNAVTRALHQQAGFSLLALEATGLYDLPASLLTAPEAEAAVDASVSWLWRSSNEARPGLTYAASTVGSVNPLRMAGIDVQHGAASGKMLLGDVERSLGQTDGLDDRWPVVRQTLGAAFENPFAPVDSATQAATVQAVEDYVGVLETESRAALALKSALANALVPWTRSFAPRDRQMGENTVALVDGTNKKAIVWGATSHVARRLPAIDTMDPEWSYDESVTMGDGIHRAFGDNYYVVAFTACGGTYGASAIVMGEEDIGPPEAGSIEALVCAAPFETAAFLDLRTLSRTESGAWLSVPLVARPLGYGAQRASWPIVLDGLIVIREMTPSTPYAP